MSLAALQIIEEEFTRANRGRAENHVFSVKEVMDLKTAIDLRIMDELVEIPEPKGLRPEAFAVAVESLPNEFRMVAGPYPTPQEALNFRPGTAPSDSFRRIIHFLPDGTEEVTHRWHHVRCEWEPVEEPDVDALKDDEYPSEGFLDGYCPPVGRQRDPEDIPF
jgi:hypothetical protein